MSIDGAAGSGQQGDRRRWALYAAAVVVGAGSAVTGVLVAAAHPARGTHAHRHGPVFVVVFAAVAAVLVAAGVSWQLRRQLNRPAMRRLRGWDLSQRRATARAVTKGDQLSEDQRNIAQAQLEHLIAAGRTVRFLPVGIVAFILLAIADTGGQRVLWVVIACIELIAVSASVLLRRRQIHRFEQALGVRPAHSRD